MELNYQFDINFRYALLLAIALFLTAGCDMVSVDKQERPIKLLGGANSVSLAEMNRLRGEYRLRQLVLEDTEEGVKITFGNGENLPVVGDSGRKVLYDAQETFIELNPDQCHLKVSGDNSCRFRWEFNASNEDINKKSFRLGRFRISGNEIKASCFKRDGNVEAPGSLVPLNNRTYRREGRSLVIEGYEENIRETLYYERLR